MNIQFASPRLLILLLVIPLLVIRYLWVGRRQGSATMQYAVISLVHNLPRSWRATLHPITDLLRLIAISLIIVAMARPQSVEGQQIVSAKGIDIALVLDISGSMSSRLDAARSAIDDFISARTYDRIGMVVFANQAFVLSPLTLDRNHIIRVLDQVELAPELGLDDGTAIGSALAHAANLLTSGDAESKVIVLLTDGINNAGPIHPMKAAEATEALGIRLYTIFSGISGEYRIAQKDEFGEMRVVSMDSTEDEKLLAQMAELTGGLYFQMEDTSGLQSIYEEINQLEKTEVEVQAYSLFTELAGWLLVPAIFILLVEMVLRQTVFRKIP